MKSMQKICDFVTLHHFDAKKSIAFQQSINFTLQKKHAETKKGSTYLTQTKPKLFIEKQQKKQKHSSSRS